MGAFRQTFPAAATQLATTPGTTLYTCPTGTKAEVRKLTFLNTTGTARTVTVALIRSGASTTPAAGNTIWSGSSVPLTATAPRGVECFEIEGQVLNPGDFIQAFADAGTAVTPFGSVVEFT